MYLYLRNKFSFQCFHSLHQFPFISFLFWVLLLYSRLALVNDVLYSFLPQSQFIHLSIYMIIAIYRKFSSYRLVIRRAEGGTECNKFSFHKYLKKKTYFAWHENLFPSLNNNFITKNCCKSFDWLGLQWIIFLWDDV